MENCATDLKEVPLAIKNLVNAVTDLEDVYAKLSQRFESVLSQHISKPMNTLKDCNTEDVKLAQEIQDNVGRLKSITEKFNDLTIRCQL